MLAIDTAGMRVCGLHEPLLPSSKCAPEVLDKCARVATSVATQALRLGGTERHWMEWGPYLSSQDGSGRVQLEG
jgi:hypothetical protein